MVKKGSALDQAMEELKKLSGDPGFSEIVQARAKEIMDDVSFRSAAKRLGIREGFEEGKEQGIKEGVKNEKIEIVKKLLKENVDVEVIQNVTRLKKEEIEKLKHTNRY